MAKRAWRLGRHPEFAERHPRLVWQAAASPCSPSDVTVPNGAPGASGLSVTGACPPRNGEGDRAKRGGGDSRFTPRPVVARARALRKATTKPEHHLWQYLRQRPGGLKFRRQHPVGPYIVDFCCLSARLVVEIDGFAHDTADRPNRDAERDKFITENGYRVLRVSARRVISDVESVVGAIVARTESPLHRPMDGPPPRAGEDS